MDRFSEKLVTIGVAALLLTGCGSNTARSVDEKGVPLQGQALLNWEKEHKTAGTSESFGWARQYSTVLGYELFYERLFDQGLADTGRAPGTALDTLVTTAEIANTGLSLFGAGFFPTSMTALGLLSTGTDEIRRNGMGRAHQAMLAPTLTFFRLYPPGDAAAIHDPIAYLGPVVEDANSLFENDAAKCRPRSEIEHTLQLINGDYWWQRTYACTGVTKGGFSLVHRILPHSQWAQELGFPANARFAKTLFGIDKTNPESARSLYRELAPHAPPGWVALFVAPETEGAGELRVHVVKNGVERVFPLPPDPFARPTPDTAR